MLGHESEIVGELERLVPITRCASGYGSAMLALYRCGRQAEALAAYQDGRRALLDELGIEPGPAAAGARTGDPESGSRLDPTVQVGGGGVVALGPGRTGVFVGRERELALLDEALADARSGRGQAGLLSGEAGIGKSRLADELSSRATGHGMHVLWGRCWEEGGAPGVLAVGQALRSYVRDCEAPTTPRALGSRAPMTSPLCCRSCASSLGPAGDHVLDSEDARFRLFDSTAPFCAGGSQWSR